MRQQPLEPVAFGVCGAAALAAAGSCAMPVAGATSTRSAPWPIEVCGIGFDPYDQPPGEFLTASEAWLAARAAGGRFVLRVEDLDRHGHGPADGGAA